MSLALTLTPCAGEAELSDPEVCGEFAEAMQTIASKPHVAPWRGYIARSGMVPVGFGSFKGEPDDGTVEISYLTFPHHTGTGVATCVAAEMIVIARGAGVHSVIAHTLCDTNASTAVLVKNGFQRDGVGHDDDVGEVWRWQVDL